MCTFYNPKANKPGRKRSGLFTNYNPPQTIKLVPDYPFVTAIVTEILYFK